LFLICGISSFITYFLADYIEYKGKSLKYSKFLSYSSVILLLISVIGLIIFSPKWHIPLYVKLIFLVLSIIAFIFLYKALFVEVAFYKDKKEKIIKTGIYKLCRHPGVLLLFLLLFFLSLSSGSVYLFYCAFLFSILNLFIALFEDKIFLPHKFKEYEEYKKNTPFLFPKL